MSLVETNHISDEIWEVKCPCCKKSVGRFTNEEIGELACAGILPYCFDCDPAAADTIPLHLLEWADVWMVTMANRVFLAEYFDGYRDQGRKAYRFTRINWTTYHALKTGYMPGSRLSLSSSTKLHKTGNGDDHA